jgi:glycine cleavage system aminomethyltransferase T
MITFRHCDQITVEATNEGDVCIRQQSYNGEEDHSIIVPLDRLNALCNAMKAVAEKIGAE